MRIHPAALDEDAHTREPMAPRGVGRSIPTTDEKKVRRQIRTAHQETPPMSTQQREVEILQAMGKATPSEQQVLLAELDQIRSARVAQQAPAGVDFSAQVASRFAAVPTWTPHTSATDWLDKVVETPDDATAHHTAQTEATLWFSRTSPELRAHREEFAEQAMGMARRVAGPHGLAAPAIEHAFLHTVGRLHKQAEEQSGQAESGLPVGVPADGYGDTEGNKVLDNFQPPVDPINQAVVDQVEGDGSMRAPMVQENAQESPERTARRRTAAEYGKGQVVTEDGKDVNEGDRVFNYYDMKWGVIRNVEAGDDPWFDVMHEDGTKAYLNGSRISTFDPRERYPDRFKSASRQVQCQSCGESFTDSSKMGAESCKNCGSSDLKMTSSRIAGYDSDGVPCCRAFYTSGGRDHEPGCFDENEKKKTGGRRTAKVYMIVEEWTGVIGSSPLTYVVVSQESDGTARFWETEGKFDSRPDAEASIPDGAEVLDPVVPNLNPVSAHLRTAGIDLTEIRIEDRSSNLFSGRDSSGARVTFRASDSDAEDLVSVMTGDLAVNFSGITIDESEIVPSGTTAHLHMAAEYGDQRACAVCGSDIEYHGEEVGWIDRGGNGYCDSSGQHPLIDGGDGGYGDYPHVRHVPYVEASRRTASDPISTGDGNAASSLPDVQVGGENDRPMWPWELTEDGQATDQGASNVAGVPTPGGSTGYPQPTAALRRLRAGILGDLNDGYQAYGGENGDGTWWWEVFGPEDDPQMMAPLVQGTAASEEEADQAAADAASEYHARRAFSSLPSKRAVSWTLTYSEPSYITEDGDVSSTPTGTIPMEYIAKVPEGELRVYNVIGGWLWQINGPNPNASPLVEFDGANGDPFGPRDGLGLEEAKRAVEKAYSEWSGKTSAHRTLQSSRVIASDPLDDIPPMGKPPAGWAEAQDPDRPSYHYETGPDGHRDCDHANDYCQYTPNNNYVPLPREARRSIASESWGIFTTDSDKMVAGPYPSSGEATTAAQAAGYALGVTHYVGTTLTDISVTDVQSGIEDLMTGASKHARQVQAAKCSNCTNGNHSGTNGTAGCKGGSCSCSCNSKTAASEYLAEGTCAACGEKIVQGIDSPGVWYHEVSGTRGNVDDPSGLDAMHIAVPKTGAQRTAAGDWGIFTATEVEGFPPETMIAGPYPSSGEATTAALAAGYDLESTYYVGSIFTDIGVTDVQSGIEDLMTGASKHDPVRQAAFRRRVRAGMHRQANDGASRRPFVREAMPSPAELNVSIGDIFYGSWGYDQTNVNFYEVTGLTGASVKVREVPAVPVDGTSAHGPSVSVVPDKGNYIGPEMTKRLSSGYQGRAAIRINDVISAWLWDGTPKHQTGYGYGH